MTHDTPLGPSPARPGASGAAGSDGLDRLRAALHGAVRAVHPERGAARTMLTGLTALSLLGFPGVPVPSRLEHIDVLAGAAFVGRARRLPRPRLVEGLPCAPVARAVADAVGQVSDPAAVRSLLTESVHTADCEPGAVLRELAAAGLLERAESAGAVDALLAAGRSLAETRLYAMVRDFSLPDPLWNVDLRLPDGSYLGCVDAYWPEQSVALELDARIPGRDAGVAWPRVAHGREELGRLGVELLRTTPAVLRGRPDRLAGAVHGALAGAAERAPQAYLVVLPR